MNFLKAKNFYKMKRSNQASRPACRIAVKTLAGSELEIEHVYGVIKEAVSAEEKIDGYINFIDQKGLHKAIPKARVLEIDFSYDLYTVYGPDWAGGRIAEFDQIVWLRSSNEPHALISKDGLPRHDLYIKNPNDDDPHPGFYTTSNKMVDSNLLIQLVARG